MEIITLIIVVLLLIGVFLGIGGWIFQLCWKVVMPYLFHLSTITFWQSFAICTILYIVGSFLKGYSSKD